MARRSHQAGFTLVEMLAVVALVGILAAIALPSFFSTARRAKGAAEAQTYFNDLRIRLDQFLQENGQYPPSIGEDTTWPTTPGPAAQPIGALPAEWQAIKVVPSGPSQVYCGYTWVTGTAGDGSNIGPQGTAFGFTAPATNWYYVLAHCNLDGDSAVDGYYFSSSVDPTFRKLNEGK